MSLSLVANIRVLEINYLNCKKKYIFSKLYTLYNIKLVYVSPYNVFTVLKVYFELKFPVKIL